MYLNWLAGNIFNHGLFYNLLRKRHNSFVKQQSRARSNLAVRRPLQGSTLDRGRAKRNFFVLITFVLLSSLLFWPVFLGKVNINGQMLVSLNGIYGENIAFKPIGADQLRIYFPSYSFTVSELKKFRLPLWNPYSFAGQPHVGELQSGVFILINVLALFLPFDVFWNLLRIVPCIFGALFMYFYLKRYCSENKRYIQR